MLRKIAIVGANGFVGRHVLELLVQKGIEVIGIVRSDSGEETVRRLGGRPLRIVDLEESSILDCRPALEGCDGLVYTASVSARPKAADPSRPDGLTNVVAACQAASVSRFIFFSGLGIAHYGMNPHCTNPYFLAKMAGEVALFRSSMVTTVFRPSYIFGAGDEFLSPLIHRMVSSATIEVPGDALYRLQPISVQDAARAVASALQRPDTDPRVVDLVGPEILSYRLLIQRVAAILRRPIDVTERPVAEALAQARSSRYLGLRAHDLACLLCDEVSDPGAVESLIGRPLETVDSMIAQSVEALRSSGLPA